MQKKNKILIILLLIVSVIAVVLAAHYIEEQIFYDTIKQVSDLENKSDIENNKLNSQTSISNKEANESTLKSINTTSEEILMLQDLKTKVFNKSYLEYIDIEINRLTCENKTYSTFIDDSNIYEQYKNGEIESSRALSLINDHNEEANTYTDKVKEYKVESDAFLSRHTDMKEKFNQLGIDEDFMSNQIEEVNVEYIS